MSVHSNGSVERVVARLADQVERRYYGKYRGSVVDNADPEQLGRLKLCVPSVLGEEVVTGWAMPCAPFGGADDQGQFFVPDVDAGVWVEFEEGDPEFPIWVGCFWTKPGGESEAPRPTGDDGASADAPQDPPTRKILKTAQGHSLQFEDGNETLRIILADGDEENRIVFSDDGITITNKRNVVTMHDEGITIADANGNTITQESGGTTIEDGNGNAIALGRSSGFPAGPGIEVNGGTRICLEGVVNWLMSHTHIGNMGAPCPVNPADIAPLTQALSTPGSGILSDTVKAS